MHSLCSIFSLDIVDIHPQIFRVLLIGFGHEDGRLDRDSEYSTMTLFNDIKTVQPSLTSFTVQVVRKEMPCEAEYAVQPLNGLHTSVRYFVGKITSM
jgi:hypothetical protein